LQNKWKLGKNTSSGIIVICFQLVFILILTIIIPALYNQGVAFMKMYPLILNLIEVKFLPIIPEAIAKIYIETSKNINIEELINLSFKLDKEKLVTQAYNSGIMIVNFISTFFLAPVLTFYMLRDWQNIYKTTLNLAPIHFKPDFSLIVFEIREKVSAYIVGVFYSIVVLSLLYGVGLSLTGLRFGFFIGILTAVLSIIPYIGFTVCFVVAILIAFATKMTFLQIGIIIFVFCVVQIIESNYIVPKFVGGKVGLHPLWIIFGLLAGGSLLGFIGLLLAIPITTIASVLIRHYIKKYQNSEYYED
jgi:predicted PurR-regulated permease PerM